LEKIKPAADRQRRRGAHVFLGPFVRRDVGFDKAPVHQILRVPPAAGDGDEQEVFALVIDDDRVRAGAERDAASPLLEVVFVVDVDGVAVGLLAGELGVGGGWVKEGRERRPEQKNCGAHGERFHERKTLDGVGGRA
jgi:hypothetical protein